MARPPKDNPTWVSAKAIREALGISNDHLARLRQEGLFKEGKHWRSVGRPQAARPTYRYHLKRCELAFDIAPELR